MNILPPAQLIMLNSSVQGRLRINRKNYHDAFLTCPAGGPDIYIENVRDRNKAMDGDMVIVRINHVNLWKVNTTAIINRWDEWSSILQPVILSIIEENNVSNSTEKTTEPQHKRNRQKRSVQNDATETKVANSSKIPSNLPNEISQITAAHLIRLPIWFECVQRTGCVEAIIEHGHARIAGGYLKPCKHGKDFALFCPTDSRFPRMYIPIEQCPHDFTTSPNRYINILFAAQMNSWKGEFAIGDLIRLIGDTKSIENRVEAILIENQVDDSDFPPEVYELTELNNLTDSWSIPENEYSYRRDLTNECIFTIDPKTARDLDDAVSVKELNPGIYEVGVHIADVSFFVNESTPVDQSARERTTSVYLVDRVIPMLPRILCEKLCSLTPGEPKLTFSVIWKITKEGKILDEWFGRTIIRSCVKLAYEHALDMIENRDDTCWIEESVNMPQLYAHNYNQISKCVNMLNDIAVNLRKARFDGGALRIDKIKLQFELDLETGIPNGFSAQERTLANTLIEEFMLLANIAVAKKIYQHYPDLAFLRRHPPSDGRLLKEVEEFCKVKQCSIDVASSGSIQRSLNEIESRDATMSKVITSFLLRAMKNAEYFCTGALGDVSLYRHYALNVPFYTHFTSPIRRYPDVIVHRLLSSALGYSNSPCEDVMSLTGLAELCNKRKLAAKNVSDQSAKIYFNLYVKQCGPYEEVACVTRINDQSFDVMLINCDEKGRVHLNTFEQYLKSYSFESYAGVRRLVIKWKDPGDIMKRLKKEAKKLRKKNRSTDSSSQSTSSNQVNVKQGKNGKNERNGKIGKNGKESIPDLDQVIQVFDIVKVKLFVDDKDLMQLKVSMALPDFILKYIE